MQWELSWTLRESANIITSYLTKIEQLLYSHTYLPLIKLPYWWDCIISSYRATPMVLLTYQYIRASERKTILGSIHITSRINSNEWIDSINVVESTIINRMIIFCPQCKIVYISKCTITNDSESTRFSIKWTKNKSPQKQVLRQKNTTFQSKYLSFSLPLGIISFCLFWEKTIDTERSYWKSIF